MKLCTMYNDVDKQWHTSGFTHCSLFSRWLISAIAVRMKKWNSELFTITRRQIRQYPESGSHETSCKTCRRGPYSIARVSFAATELSEHNSKHFSKGVAHHGIVTTRQKWVEPFFENGVHAAELEICTGRAWSVDKFRLMVKTLLLMLRLVNV